MKPLLLMLLVLTVCACSTQTTPTQAQPSEPEATTEKSMGLDSANQAWLNQDSQNYDYLFQKQCYCSHAYTQAIQVSVRDGKIESARYQHNQQAVPERVLQSLRTIEQWFSYIQAGYDKGYAKLEASYHPAYGYPERITVDPRLRISDDEKDIQISDLRLYE